MYKNVTGRIPVYKNVTMRLPVYKNVIVCEPVEKYERTRRLLYLGIYSVIFCILCISESNGPELEIVIVRFGFSCRNTGIAL